jgi:hypothetical protein
MTRRMDGTLGGMGAYRKRAHDAGK